MKRNSTDKLVLCINMFFFIPHESPQIMYLFPEMYFLSRPLNVKYMDLCASSPFYLDADYYLVREPFSESQLLED